MATYGFQSSACGRVPRRRFLADLGMGFTGLALGAMLHRDGFASERRWLDAAEWAAHISRRRPKASFGCS